MNKGVLLTGYLSEVRFFYSYYNLPEMIRREDYG